MKSKSGFSVVEVAVIIVVIAILVTIGTVSFLALQRDARDSKRAANTTILAEALEKYHQAGDEAGVLSTEMQIEYLEQVKATEDAAAAEDTQQ